MKIRVVWGQICYEMAFLFLCSVKVQIFREGRKNLKKKNSTMF